MKQGPVSDREYGRQVNEAYLIAVDVLVSEHYPNADGDGVRAISELEWKLMCSAPKGPGRTPTIDAVARLARMADERQRINRMPEAELFGCFPGGAA